MATVNISEGGSGQLQQVAGTGNGCADENGAVPSMENSTIQDPKQLSTRELLNCSVQQLVADINAKRKRDTAILDDFKKALDMHCSAAYASMEAAIYNMYESNHEPIQNKLQELFAILDKIAKQEQEQEDFKGALAALYSDIQGPPL